MANYYNYDFVSPTPIYALIKEELKSYFQTGAIDDLLFPIWTDKCLKRLGRGSYAIKHAILKVADFEAKLPIDFNAMREAWMCSIISQRVPIAPALYQQITTAITAQYPNTNCIGNTPCLPDTVEVIYKTTNESFVQNFKISHLLKPGNIAVRNDCALDCLNYYSSSYESFDIRDGKIITNLREADVYILYYSKNLTDEGLQLIPDSFEITEFIEAFIKSKVFEMLSNQITDETYNQIAQKKQEYEEKADEAFISAQIDSKKQTIYKRFQAIKRDMNRLSIYNIP